MKSPSSESSRSPLLDLSVLGKSSIGRRGFAILGRLLEPVLKFGELNRAYAELLCDGRSETEPFFFRVLRVLEIELKVSETDRERLPKQGPIVLVSNHPFGGIDGIALGAFLERERPDFRLLVNYLLTHIEGIDSSLISVDPFGGERAKQANLAGIRQAMKWLKAGGVLATWPSGTVSHWHLRKWRVTDPLWAENVGALIRRTGATVVPVFFPGQNSLFFQFSGLLHPRLRTLLLVREMMKRCGKTVELRLGNPISSNRLERFTQDRSLMDYLRLKTYILQDRRIAEKVSFVSGVLKRKAKTGEPVAETQSVENLEAEIVDLDETQKLVDQGEWQVYVARAAQIPRLLLEIGRCREITFRAVGEGTGNERDLDRFDSDYYHLFLWNSAERELVGAYRMGLTDEILPIRGKHGLYTTTLFRFKSGMLGLLNPAIELGRSFIVEKYQRRLQPLALLWKGIGHFIVQNPKYKTLFGPVSISREYASLSKTMMVTYLKENTLHPTWSSQVKAKHPPRSRNFGHLDRNSFRRSVRDIDDVSALISEIEREERGVPVLLRQYLKLNATMLSFNVDPDFNDCIDGLVLADLTKAGRKTLERYMGQAGTQAFLDFHEVRSSEEESAKIDRHSH